LRFPIFGQNFSRKTGGNTFASNKLARKQTKHENLHASVFTANKLSCKIIFYPKDFTYPSLDFSLLCLHFRTCLSMILALIAAHCMFLE